MSTKIPAGHIRIKRAYDPPSHDDGARVLIDRLWPRGVKKKTLALDQWAKELSPSTELRKWFGHDRALARVSPALRTGAGPVRGTVRDGACAGAQGHHHARVWRA